MARQTPSPAEELAALCAAARAQMARSGRLLHDEAGPLLSAAGFKLGLQLPDADLTEVIELLDKAMEHIRTVSQQLNPSPAARTGLKQALIGLAEAEPAVSVSYKAAAKPPAEIAPILYEAAAAAVREAVRARASHIRVAVTGKSGILIRITDNGRGSGRARALAVSTLLARAASISLDIGTKKDTIVSIRYGPRSTIGG
jgi:signal transduction histidine kinase